MQTAWSRSLRPQSTCRCISCTKSLPSTLSRRTTTGIARKRFTASDAFSLLLGPVLGGALIADTKAKDKRRREWDEKIAAVQAEVEQMRQSGFKPFTIRRRNLRRLPALSRSYSSVAAASVAVADDGDSIGAVDHSSAPEPLRHDLEPASTPVACSHDVWPDDESSEPYTESNLNQATIEKCKRLQRLVAIKLAIRMILHIHIGKSPRYIVSSSDYVYDQGRLPQNVNELIRHLKQISNSLKLMNADNLRSSWRAYQSLTWGRTCGLDEDMTDLARHFRRGEMNVTQLVERFAEILLSSSDSPTVRGYIPFLSVLSRARFDELGYMVDGTMMEARLPYDRHAVFTLLWQYGKNKEAHYFERLIKKLTTDSANAQFGERWLWRNVSGVLVPIPPSQDPQILQILVYAALKCNQPHRAEAWSTILAGTRTGNMWLSHVIRNFLKYYSAHRSWHKGLIWMGTALDRAEMLATQGIRHLQRITFSMLEFCVAHGKRALYRDILKAAGECRLGVYSADPDLTLTQRSTDILEEWKLCHKRVHNQNIDALSCVEKAKMFKWKLQHIHQLKWEGTADAFHFTRPVDHNEQLRMRGNSKNSAGDLQDIETASNMCRNGTSRGSNDVQDEAEPGQWKELCRRQQIQLESLKRQLESLKIGQKSKLASATGEYGIGHLDNVEDIPEIPEAAEFSTTTPKLTAEQVNEAEQVAFPSGPLSFTSNSLSNSDQPFSSPFLKLTIPSEDQHQSPWNTPPLQIEGGNQPTTCTNSQSGMFPVPEKIVFSASPPDPPKTTPLLRSPTTSEIERALDFCTHINNRFAAHIMQLPLIPPLYTLVSTVPCDLLIEISIDRFFVHFIQQMLTQLEQGIFWIKLTVEVRKRKGARALSEARALASERKQLAISLTRRRELKAALRSAKPEETKPPPSIIRKSSSTSPTSHIRKEARPLPEPEEAAPPLSITRELYSTKTAKYGAFGLSLAELARRGKPYYSLKSEAVTDTAKA